MKLATYKDGSRDGQLVVVSRDLERAHFATAIASRLQSALDDWNFVAPQLQDLYETVNGGKARHAFAFDARQCMAPLPRAYLWAEATAYLHHLALQCRAAGIELPARAQHGPRLHRGAGDELLGPCDDVVLSCADWGIDFEAGLAVVTGDVAMASPPAQALEGVRLLMLSNSWSLRHLLTDLADPDAAGRLHGKPAAAFSPVAVTPDELGPAWQAGRVQLTMQCRRNGKPFGAHETGPEMSFHFGQLIAQLCVTRRLRAGSIVGSGPVSQTDPARGACCIADRRAMERIDGGEASTPFMTSGERVRIEAIGGDGLSVFGAIDQAVLVPALPEPATRRVKELQ